MLRIICILTVLLMDLTLLKPVFCQSKVEYHTLSRHGSIVGVISIIFPEGWKTYWKFPGPNGFIPKMKILKKANLKSFSISWPYPKELGPSDFTYLGYDNDLLLPVKLKKIDENKNIYLLLNLSFGICKSVCVVQNKTLRITDENDTNYLLLDKLQKSTNRITMTTDFGNSNKCRIKKITDSEYKITFENHLMENTKLVSGALVDYEGSSWIIEKQSFYPKLGRVEAFLKLDEPRNSKIDLENFSLLYLHNDIAKKTIGCPS